MGYLHEEITAFGERVKNCFQFTKYMLSFQSTSSHWKKEINYFYKRKLSLFFKMHIFSECGRTWQYNFLSLALLSNFDISPSFVTLVLPTNHMNSFSRLLAIFSMGLMLTEYNGNKLKVEVCDGEGLPNKNTRNKKGATWKCINKTFVPFRKKKTKPSSICRLTI